MKYFINIGKYFKSKARFALALRKFFIINSPRKLAYALGLTLSVSIIPLPFLNTIILSILSFRLRLNHIIVQTLNYIMFPVQIALFVPFIRLGQKLFNGPSVNIDFDTFSTMIRTDFANTIISLGYSEILALGAWAIMAVILFVLFFNSTLFVAKGIFSGLLKRVS